MKLSKGKEDPQKDPASREPLPRGQSPQPPARQRPVTLTASKQRPVSSSKKTSDSTPSFTQRRRRQRLAWDVSRMKRRDWNLYQYMTLFSAQGKQYTYLNLKGADSDSSLVEDASFPQTMEVSNPTRGQDDTVTGRGGRVRQRSGIPVRSPSRTPPNDKLQNLRTRDSMPSHSQDFRHSEVPTKPPSTGRTALPSAAGRFGGSPNDRHDPNPLTQGSRVRFSSFNEKASPVTQNTTKASSQRSTTSHGRQQQMQSGRRRAASFPQNFDKAAEDKRPPSHFPGEPRYIGEPLTMGQDALYENGPDQDVQRFANLPEPCAADAVHGGPPPKGSSSTAQRLFEEKDNLWKIDPVLEEEPDESKVEKNTTALRKAFSLVKRHPPPQQVTLRTAQRASSRLQKKAAALTNSDKPVAPAAADKATAELKPQKPIAKPGSEQEAQTPAKSTGKLHARKRESPKSTVTSKYRDETKKTDAPRRQRVKEPKPRPAPRKVDVLKNDTIMPLGSEPKDSANTPHAKPHDATGKQTDDTAETHQALVGARPFSTASPEKAVTQKESETSPTIRISTRLKQGTVAVSERHDVEKHSPSSSDLQCVVKMKDYFPDVKADFTSDSYEFDITLLENQSDSITIKPLRPALAKTAPVKRPVTRMKRSSVSPRERSPQPPTRQRWTKNSQLLKKTLRGKPMPKPVPQRKTDRPKSTKNTVPFWMKNADRKSPSRVHFKALPIATRGTRNSSPSSLPFSRSSQSPLSSPENLGSKSPDLRSKVKPSFPAQQRKAEISPTRVQSGHRSRSPIKRPFPQRPCKNPRDSEVSDTSASTGLPNLKPRRQEKTAPKKLSKCDKQGEKMHARRKMEGRKGVIIMKEKGTQSPEHRPTVVSRTRETSTQSPDWDKVKHHFLTGIYPDAVLIDREDRKHRSASRGRSRRSHSPVSAETERRGNRRRNLSHDSKDRKQSLVWDSKPIDRRSSSSKAAHGRRSRRASYHEKEKRSERRRTRFSDFSSSDESDSDDFSDDFSDVNYRRPRGRRSRYQDEYFFSDSEDYSWETGSEALSDTDEKDELRPRRKPRTHEKEEVPVKWNRSESNVAIHSSKRMSQKQNRLSHEDSRPGIPDRNTKKRGVRRALASSSDEGGGHTLRCPEPDRYGDVDAVRSPRELPLTPDLQRPTRSDQSPDGHREYDWSKIDLEPSPPCSPPAVLSDISADSEVPVLVDAQTNEKMEKEMEEVLFQLYRSAHKIALRLSALQVDVKRLRTGLNTLPPPTPQKEAEPKWEGTLFDYLMLLGFMTFQLVIQYVLVKT